MPTDANMILTQGKFLSNLTDMRDGNPLNFTTPSVKLGAGGTDAEFALVMELFFPAFTNRNPGTGVGAFTAPLLTAVVQHCNGDPTIEANWMDLVSFRRLIRPQMATASTGAGTIANPIFSNRYYARFQSFFTNVRLSGNYLGSWPDFSALYVAVHPAAHRVRELD